MKYASITLAALFASAPVVAVEPIYDLGTVKAASIQAFVMANAARVWAKTNDDTDCLENAHEAMTRAADAAIFAIRAIDTEDQASEDRFVRHGMFNAKRAVKLSASCLQPNYKLPVEQVISYELPELEDQAQP